MERNVAPMETARRTHPEGCRPPVSAAGGPACSGKTSGFWWSWTVRNLDDLPYSLMRLGLVHRPLYVDRGAQTRDFDQTAPRLVWLDQTADSPDWSVDRPCSPQVVAQVLDMPEKNLSAGVFWICAAGGNSLYRHLRRINMVRVPASSLPEDSRPRHQSSDWQAMLFRQRGCQCIDPGSSLPRRGKKIILPWTSAGDSLCSGHSLVRRRTCYGFSGS